VCEGEWSCDAQAAKGNEASCRDLFKAGAADLTLLTLLLSDGIEVLQACIALLMVVLESPCVRHLLGAPLVGCRFGWV
jgi:hypothetical protein